MKTKYFMPIAVFTLIMTNTSIGQNDIILEINHYLNHNKFDYGFDAINSLNEPFEVDRMEYYLSEFSVTHDGGNITDFDSLWALVQADENATVIDLGSAAIDSVESIQFSIGVEQAFNHLDPTQYSSSHPLGPKSPSMHWGWTAGYRFVAMEGEETDGNEQFEIHALGDQNYFSTSIDIAAHSENGEIIISIYADYAEALSDIELASGVITHGDYDEAVDLLENFRDNVFSDSIPEDTTTGTTAIGKIQSTTHFTLAPNPNQSRVSLAFNGLNTIGSHVYINNMMGELIAQKSINTPTGTIEFQDLKPGIYLVTMTNLEGVQIQTETAIVTD